MATSPEACARRIPRRAAVQCNFFESLGKIADYNAKYFSTALAGLTDSRTARASHVLFGFDKYGEAGASKAEDLKVRIDGGEISFADAAQQYSTCPSAAKGGDLGTFKRGAMVPEFDAVCFDESTPLGEGVSVVKTQFGVHLVQVYERSDKA